MAARTEKYKKGINAIAAVKVKGIAIKMEREGRERERESEEMDFLT